MPRAKAASRAAVPVDPEVPEGDEHGPHPHPHPQAYDLPAFIWAFCSATIDCVILALGGERQGRGGRAIAIECHHRMKIRRETHCDEMRFYAVRST